MPKQRKRDSSMTSAVSCQPSLTITFTVPICRLADTKYLYVTTEDAKRAVHGMENLMENLTIGFTVVEGVPTTLTILSGVAVNVTVPITSKPVSEKKRRRHWEKQISKENAL